MMIGKQEWKGIRYYSVFLLLLFGIFVYAASTGWRFYNPDEVTEHSAPGSRSHGGARFYHK